MSTAGCEIAWCERATLRRQPAAGLSDAERALTRRFTDAGRTEAWRLGRELVKRLVREDAARVEVLPDDPTLTTSRPALWVGRRRSARSVSISHTDRSVAAAVADGAIGVDVTDLRDLDAAAVRFWLSAGERDLVDGSGDPDTALAVVWASKEAAYKAVNRGEPFRPARFAVADLIVTARDAGGPTEGRARLTDGATRTTCRSDWRRSGTEVLAVVTIPSRVPHVPAGSPDPAGDPTEGLFESRET